MTTPDIQATFEKFDAEFLRFDRIENKLSARPDLHAFLLLDRLFPGTTDMVSAAEHDEIFLEVSPEALVGKATEGQILDLVRCGLRYSDEYESLCMFV